MAISRYINVSNDSSIIADTINNIGDFPSEYPEKPEIDQKHARCCDGGWGEKSNNINMLNKEQK